MGRRSNNSDSRHARSSHEASQPRNNPIRRSRESRGGASLSFCRVLSRCAVPSPSTPHLLPRTYRALAAAFERVAPMAAAATTVYRSAPVIPARSRRRTPAPRASACGSLVRRPRQLRCEFVAVGGNGALSGEDDLRFADRVRDSLAYFVLSFSFFYSCCHLVEQVTCCSRARLCIVSLVAHSVGGRY
jgi:hypothetical protein